MANSRNSSRNRTRKQFEIDLLKAESELQANLILKNPKYVKLYDEYRRSGYISIQNFLAHIGYYGWELVKLQFVLSFLCRLFGSNI